MYYYLFESSTMLLVISLCYNQYLFDIYLLIIYVQIININFNTREKFPNY